MTVHVITPKIRCLIVDDEQPARERLRRMLLAHADLEVIGEAADGPEAIERITRLRPDLVLLDIQMPGCSGMDVAASLPAPRPSIIFCTAYDEYAVDAFELNALDYLLKPVSRTRLQSALERVRGTSARALDPASDRARPARFLAKLGSRYTIVPAEDVLCFSSEDSLTKLTTREKHYWMEPTLDDLEGRLGPEHFFRISRSVIVRLAEVREVATRAGGPGELTLSNGARLAVSRRRLAELMERLGRT